MEHKQNSNIDRVIDRSEFAELTGLSRTSVWRLINSGDAPKVVKINGRIIGFRESSYIEWLEKNTYA
ncbi:MAG: DNA-binding protein [Thiotrichaceae bacterium]|nr:MAG: DNA-binding protein [Thiotrichaceae bacterium]